MNISELLIKLLELLELDEESLSDLPRVFGKSAMLLVFIGDSFDVKSYIVVIEEDLVGLVRLEAVEL